MDMVIVDNEPKIRNGSGKLPDGRENWHVTGTYADAMDAPKNMAFYSPDVVITDIKMPEINGLDMVDRMGETDQEAYIIILSGYSDFDSTQRTIGLGVTRYLTKPTKKRKLLGVLEEIEGKMLERQKDGEEKKEVSNLMVQKAMDYIALNYSKKVNLKNAAGELYLSLNYLSELFKRYTDKNISRYITQFRLDKVRRYLQQPGHKIANMSDLVGFSDPGYFSSMLKRQYGMIPNEYCNRSIKQLTKQQV